MNTVWKNNNQRLNVLKVGKVKKIIFYPEGKLKEIININSECNCTVPEIIDNTVVIYYTPKKIPIHLAHIGEYYVVKSFKINYQDGNVETLSFSATIKN